MTERPPGVYVRLRSRSWLRRVFQLTGDVEAVVEYNALKAGVGYSDVGETDETPGDNHAVLVDGVKVASSANCDPLPSFGIRGPAGEVRVLVQVEFSSTGLLVQITRFQFVVGEETLYEEVGGKTVRIKHPPALPVPAGVPPVQPGELPIPASVEAKVIGPLPIAAREEAGDA